MFRFQKYTAPVKRIFFFLLTILFILTLTACANDRIRKKAERGALAYYQNKYGEAVEILSSKEWGFTTAILPTKIHQLAFTLSDGNTVLWDRETQQFSERTAKSAFCHVTTLENWFSISRYTVRKVTGWCAGSADLILTVMYTGPRISISRRYRVCG